MYVSHKLQTNFDVFLLKFHGLRRLNIYVFISVSYIDRGILIEIHRNLFAIYVRRTWWSNKLLITLSIRLLQSFVVFVCFFLRVKALTEAHFAHNSASYKHVFIYDYDMLTLSQ
jgi:hypothetical protein